MWLSKAISLFAITLCIASCGFKPVYKKQDQASTSPIETFLAAIEVAPNNSAIDSQQLISAVSKKLNPNHKNVPTQYRLDITVQTASYELAIQQNREATRYNQRVTVHIKLTDNMQQKTLFTDNVSLTGSYDLNESEYATFIAERDTKNRIIEQLGEEVKSQLIQYYYTTQRSKTQHK